MSSQLRQSLKDGSCWCFRAVQQTASCLHTGMTKMFCIAVLNVEELEVASVRIEEELEVANVIKPTTAKFGGW